MKIRKSALIPKIHVKKFYVCFFPTDFLIDRRGSNFSCKWLLEFSNHCQELNVKFHSSNSNNQSRYSCPHIFLPAQKLWTTSSNCFTLYSLFCYYHWSILKILFRKRPAFHISSVSVNFHEKSVIPATLRPITFNSFQVYCVDHYNM